MAIRLPITQFQDLIIDRDLRGRTSALFGESLGFGVNHGKLELRHPFQLVSVGGFVRFTDPRDLHNNSLLAHRLNDRFSHPHGIDPLADNFHRLVQRTSRRIASQLQQELRSATEIQPRLDGDLPLTAFVFLEKRAQTKSTQGNGESDTQLDSFATIPG